MALTANQIAFAQGVAAGTGLDQGVVEAWVAQEGNASGYTGSYNFLNMMAWGSQPYITTPKTGGSHWATYSSVQSAVSAAVSELNTSKHYAGIRAAVGQDPTTQMVAIGNSPWDAGHYAEGGGGPGSALIRNYNALGHGTAPAVAGPTGAGVGAGATTTANYGTIVPIPSQYQAQFQAAASKYGVPIDILALVAKDESGFNTTIVGDNGSSYGLFQIHLPSQPGITAAQAEDPTFAINWAAQRLGQVYQRYGGNALATILYNNCPACADYYAATGKWGPTNALAAASQKYLSAVLQPIGGLNPPGASGMNWNAILSGQQGNYAVGGVAVPSAGQKTGAVQGGNAVPGSTSASFLQAITNLGQGSTSTSQTSTTAAADSGAPSGSLASTDGAPGPTAGEQITASSTPAPEENATRGDAALGSTPEVQQTLATQP